MPKPAKTPARRASQTAPKTAPKIQLVRHKLTLGRAMLYLAILLLPLLAIPVMLALYLSLNQARFILPARVNAVSAPAGNLNPEYMQIPTPDGATISGVVLPASGQTRTLILAFPGNSHNPIGFATFLRESVFPETDVAIAAFSYRGYPNGVTAPSTGKPSQAAMYADSELVYDVLTTRLKPAQTKVVGYSIGTAVATHLATQRKTDALTLMAPVASVRRIVQNRYPWLPVRLLLRHPFATEDIIATLQVPTTIIYSPTDGLIPAPHVEQVLHTASPTIPLIRVEGTNHVSLVLHPSIPGLLRKSLGF